MSYTLYIVCCADGTFYTGSPPMWNGGSRSTMARRAGCALYGRAPPGAAGLFRNVSTRSAALVAEARIKRLSRAEKQKLIAASGA